MSRKPFENCDNYNASVHPAWAPLCDEFSLLEPRECPNELDPVPVDVISPPSCPAFPTYEMRETEQVLKLKIHTDDGNIDFELPDDALTWDICARKSQAKCDTDGTYYNGCLPDWLYWLKQNLPLCVITEVAEGSGINYIGCNTPGNSYIKISTKSVDECIIIVLDYNIDIPTIGRLD